MKKITPIGWKRIELHFKDSELKILGELAKNEGRSRKNYCETEIKKLISNYAMGAVRQKKKNNVL